MSQCESIRWSRSNPNRTWFWVLMKRRLFLEDNESWKSMRKRCSEGMLHNSKREAMNFNPWRKWQRPREMLSSKSWLLKKLKGELRPIGSKLLETIFKWKIWRSRPKPRRQQILRKLKDKRLSFKLLKISKWSSSKRDLTKKEKWKKNSRLRWPKNSQRMND